MTDYIFDVDGTLMNVEKRVQYAKDTKRESDKRMNWDNFLDPIIMEKYDTPNIDVCNIAQALGDQHHELRLEDVTNDSYINNIIITSARNERHRDVTMTQLENIPVEYTAMYLRDDNDFRPDDIVKAELLGKIKADGYNPTIAFDDRNQVVKKWRELGIKCYQVREGDF
jgi:hypothetical protein